MWILLAILSATCLGCYDVSKKIALNSNSVLSVLTISILISGCLLLPQWFLSRTVPEIMQNTMFFVPKIGLREHMFIVCKSALVLSSWLCAYVALKHLPLSLVAPMQATRPMWTLIGAVLIFSEVMNGWQWAGIICALGSVLVYSLVQHKTGNQQIKGQKQYLILLISGILLGSASGLYDKYLMRQFDHNAVQVYYTWYQAVMMVIIWSISTIKKASSAPSSTEIPSLFTWRWEIVGISAFLVMSDFFYFLALSHPSSLIAVVATARRAGTIIPFLYGIVVLRESNPRPKIWCLAGILTGLIFLLFGTL